MWGFAAGVAAEFGSHESILQQAAGHPFGVTFFMLLISVASIMPKFASGVPIGEWDIGFHLIWHAMLRCSTCDPIIALTEDAPLQGNSTTQPARGSLPGPLAFFNKTHEIWVGTTLLTWPFTCSQILA